MMDGAPVENPGSWTPRFVDYLFVAFNTSTAFSPTDTAVLSRWAKGLCMLQALISLSIVAILASRAVGMLSRRLRAVRGSAGRDRVRPRPAPPGGSPKGLDRPADPPHCAPAPAA